MKKLMPNGANSSIEKWRYGPLGMGFSGGSSSHTPSVPGPLDFVEAGRNVFTNFSREFDLASSEAVFYFACHYTGDPVISIAHGGEPLTIVKQERHEGSGMLSLIALGHGLTKEAANLTITATGGTLDGGAGRINEMEFIADEMTGWTYAANGQKESPLPITLEGMKGGGLVKGVFVCSLVDTNNSVRVRGAESKFKGYTISGDPIAYNINPNSGNWVLGDGWSVVGNDLVHTGRDESISYLELPAPVTGHQGRRAFIDCTRGTRAWIGNTNATNNGVGIAAGRAGYVCGGAIGDLHTFAVCAAGDVIFRDFMWVSDYKSVTWDFFSAPAENGEVLDPYLFYKPAWAIAAAEIFGRDYPPEAANG